MENADDVTASPETMLDVLERRVAVVPEAATWPLPVRHGDPAGTAHEDIGQSSRLSCPAES